MTTTMNIPSAFRALDRLGQGSAAYCYDGGPAHKSDVYAVRKFLEHADVMLAKGARSMVDRDVKDDAPPDVRAKYVSMVMEVDLSTAERWLCIDPMPPETAMPLDAAEIAELCQALDALSQWEIHENDETDPARLERIAALKAKLSGSW